MQLLIISCSEPTTREVIYIAGKFTADEYIDGSKSGKLRLKMSLEIDAVFNKNDYDAAAHASIKLMSWDLINQYYFPNGSFDGLGSLISEARKLSGKIIIIPGVAYDLCGRKVLFKPATDANESCFMSGAYNYIELKNIENIDDLSNYLPNQK